MNSSVEPALHSTLNAAHSYLGRGWAVVPIPRGEKAPRIAGWPSLRLDEAHLPAHFSHGENIGLILGSASRGITDVDLDSAEAICVADFFLPRTNLEHGRPGKPRSHRWYMCSQPPTTQRFSDPKGGCIVEIRSDGSQTMIPPSVHPTGEVLAWTGDGSPSQVNTEDLVKSVSRLAAAALLARNWPAPGSRHYAANALSGMLLRAGWSEDQVSSIVGTVSRAAGDEETRARIADVVATARRISAGRPSTGAPTLAQIVGDEVVFRIRRWLTLERQEVPWTNVANWPDPAPLGDELPTVPLLDLYLLPESFRPLVEDISDRMQAPADFAAAASIVALAGCVNRRAVIIPKRVDTSWRVVPNLWGAIVAPPGMMKSPILRSVTLPLTRMEKKWRDDFESECLDFEIEREKAELHHQAWREECKRAFKRDEPEPIQPDRHLVTPKQRRLTLTDSTFEKLHEILAENPAGVLVVRDELTGWLAGLDRDGRNEERAFFLEAWNGDSAFTIDRIGRGSIYVPACCISLLGNIQPARLRSYLSDAITGGPTDDGLFQRFQILVWPDLPKTWRLVDRVPCETALQTAERVFSVLAELPADDPLQLRFAPEAQDLFIVWFSELEQRIRGDSSLSPFFVAHLAKYRSLMPTLAGLFELADRVASGAGLTKEIAISLQHARQSAAFCDYAEAHIHRVYACVTSPEMRSARELARHIKSGDLRAPFTTRTAYLKGWTGLDTPERARGALGLLEEAGWVRRGESSPSAGGGRPSEIWLVNPEILGNA